MENLRTIQEEHKDYKWVYKDNIHITLAFFNELDNLGIKLLEKVIEKSLEFYETITFSTGEIIYIPIGVYRDKYYGYVRQKKINGLALSIEKGKEEIIKLAENIENNLIEIGEKNNYKFRTKEKRPYIPHITIARKGKKPMMNYLHIFNKYPFIVEGKVDNITIFQSEIFKGNPNRQHKETSEYKPLKIFEL